MDFELTDEQRMIVETVGKFVRTELDPHADEVEELDDVPPELARAIREKAIGAGLYAANMPEEIGGGGLDAVSMILVERELGKTSFALQMLVARPSNILEACEGEQRTRYLLPAVRGERHDCLAMTEPGSQAPTSARCAPAPYTKAAVPGAVTAIPGAAIPVAGTAVTVGTAVTRTC